jgi:hypothetical protein
MGKNPEAKAYCYNVLFRLSATWMSLPSPHGRVHGVSEQDIVAKGALKLIEAAVQAL